MSPFYHVVGVHKRATRDGTTAHGNHILGFGHLVVKPFENRSHLVYNGTRYDNQIGLAWAGAGYLKAETRKIVSGSSHTHKLNATAAGGKGEGPQRVRTTPVDYFVEHTHHNTYPVFSEFIGICLQPVVVAKGFGRHSLN